MGRHKKRGRKKVLTELQYKNNQQEYHKKWAKEKTKIINFRLNVEKDKIVLDRLNEIDNKTDYIRALILDDIFKHNNK